MLIPLVMPPDIPLWQVAVATIFAVVIGKEAFGGTGMNVLNVALTARAFLYFAYPVDMAGEVWTYIPEGANAVAGYSGATPLAIAANSVTTGENAVCCIQALLVMDGQRICTVLKICFLVLCLEVLAKHRL